MRSEVMRTIKFRGKDIENNGWVYGNLVEKTRWDLTNDFFISWCKLSKNSIDGLTDSEYVEIQVDPDTIGQFTGIKDEAGKEIYEGDIVLMENVIGYGACRGVVKWDNNGYWYTDYKGDYDHRIIGVNGIVIGNIHDT